MLSDLVGLGFRGLALIFSRPFVQLRPAPPPPLYPPLQKNRITQYSAHAGVSTQQPSATTISAPREVLQFSKPCTYEILSPKSTVKQL